MVPLSILDVRFFPEAVPKLSENFLSLSLPRDLLSFYFRLIILEDSDFFDGLPISTRSYVGVLSGLSVVPKSFPIFSGLWLFSKGLL